MSSTPTTWMQIPTPPMTMVEMEWERHHSCHDKHYFLPNNSLSPTFGDWTLFAQEEVSPAGSPPMPVPVEQNAEAPRPQQVRAQNDSRTPKQQRQRTVKRTKMTNPVAHTAKSQTDELRISRNDNHAPSRSKESGVSEARFLQVKGFEPMPRTSVPTPTFRRYPTPPVEDMGQMFAPIEALGEDLRYYAASRKT